MIGSCPDLEAVLHATILVRTFSDIEDNNHTLGVDLAAPSEYTLYWCCMILHLVDQEVDLVLL